MERSWTSLQQSPEKLRMPYHHTLQLISELCTTALLSGQSAHGALLSSSVRQHFLSRYRHKLYNRKEPAYTRTPLEEASDISELSQHVLSFLLSILHPPVSLPHVYNALYSTLEHSSQNAPSYSILRNFWHDLMTILRGHLYSWLVHAHVSDPHGQFFISQGSTNVVIDDRLPTFVSKLTAERVLFAGNARKCVIQLRNGVTEEHNVAADSDFDTLLTDPIRASLELDAATLLWRDAAAHQLSEVLPFGQVKERIYLLRQYLLLGHSTFWRNFFDALRAKAFLLDVTRETEPADREEVERSLNQIFLTTAAEFADINDGTKLKGIQEPPMTLTITDSGDIYPSFSLSFAESQVLSSRCSVYCDVFSVTFNVRRVACDLRASFVNLQQMERQLRIRTAKRRGRAAVAKIAWMHELRRRMANFIDGFEWYLQSEVLEPQFRDLIAILEEHEQGHKTPSSTSGQSFFDVVRSRHEGILDKVFVECFVAHEQINARLDAIFTACFAFCDFAQNNTIDSLQGDDFSALLSSLHVSFSRNLNLLVRMLSQIMMLHGSVDSKIPALLVRINFNNFLLN